MRGGRNSVGIFWKLSTVFQRCVIVLSNRILEIERGDNLRFGLAVAQIYDHGFTVNDVYDAKFGFQWVTLNPKDSVLLKVEGSLVPDRGCTDVPLD